MATLTPTTVDEAEFVRRIQQYDAEAWDEFYDTYFPKMYRYVYIHTGDRDAAEDLAAQVFERACEGVRRFRYRGVPLSAWLYKVAHNVVVDWQRKRGRSREVRPSGDYAGPDAMERSIQRDEIARAMASLTEEQRQVVFLRQIEGHSGASAGRIMGKNEGAIRSLEFRALAMLRKALAQGETRGEQR